MSKDHDESALMRINRAIAQAGVCSRRKADELIQAGRVRVNGAPVQSPGLRIDPSKDNIEVDGARLEVRKQESQEQLYILLHKPPKVMTTLHDPQGRKTVLDLLPRQIAVQRPVPVGRLDFMSEGLLLLSTDGEFTHRLTHPRYHLPKLYEVLLRDTVTPEKLEAMRQGMQLSDERGEEKLAPLKAEVRQTTRKGTLLHLTLEQGVNRQIRRMCKELGLGIVFLRRMAQGPVSLGELPAGSWRHLTRKELAGLKQAVGLKS